MLRQRYYSYTIQLHHHYIATPLHHYTTPSRHHNITTSLHHNTTPSLHHYTPTPLHLSPTLIHHYTTTSLDHYVTTSLHYNRMLTCMGVLPLILWRVEDPVKRRACDMQHKEVRKRPTPTRHTAAHHAETRPVRRLPATTSWEHSQNALAA